MRFTAILALFLCTLTSFSQQYRSPLDIPLHLSANCGELRNNHFHSGIDIKTQSVTGKRIYSVEDGYISRISVSPSGYGLALYIDHPSTGHTSVYGHLESYTPEIEAYIKKKQYEQESFRVNLTLTPSEIPVKKGDVVAYSGNSGGSGGPHLHFEIRDSKTQEILDPLVFFKGMIADTKSPDVRGIAVYPVPGRGVVNGSITPLRQSVSLLKNGTYSSPQKPIEVWGIIGLGIKSYDKMDNNSNIYGVKMATMSVDGKEVFKYNIERFSFDQTRMLNTFTDFEDWRSNKSFFMQSFIEPGNLLPFYTAVNSGYLTIDEERPYNISYKLEDLYGNSTTYNFKIIGKKQNIDTPSGCSLVMVWDHDNRYISDDFSLIINKGNLYNNICFTLSQRTSEIYHSNIFAVNNKPIALDKSGEVKIKMTSDPLTNKKQYGIVQINGNKTSWMGGTYNNGYISTNIRELGIQLAVSSDTQAPVITPVVNKKKGASTRTNEIKLRLTDNLSGIASFKGTIDGKFALFTHDVKSNVYTYKCDASKIGTNKTHKLVFTAIDGCGNSSTYTTDFDF